MIVAAAGCDSDAVSEPPSVQPPSDQPPSVQPSVQRVAPIEDLHFYLDGDPVSIDLTSKFEANDAAGPLSVSATGGGEVVALTLDGPLLRVSPSALGASTVVVSARGAEGGAATDTFAVEVSGPCPTEPAAGTDFFPVTGGDTWAFATEFGLYPSRGSPGYRTEGITTWAFGAAECRGGVRYVTVEESFAGRNYSPATWGGPFLPRDSVRYDRTLEFARADSVTIGVERVGPVVRLGTVNSEVPDGRYSGGHPVPASYPASSPDTAATESPCPPCDRTGSAPEQTLVRERGAVSLSFRQNRGLAYGTGYYKLTRVE